MSRTSAFANSLAKEMVTSVTATRDGRWIHVEGHRMPHKWVGTPEEIYHTNIYKALLKNPPIRLTLEGTIAAINAIGNKVMKAHAPENWNEYTHTTQWLNDVLMVGLMNAGVDSDIAADFARNTALVIEYDQAYRFRLQDLMGETSVERLTKNPSAEIARLLMINSVRDKSAGDKISSFGRILVWLAKLPKVKRAIRRSIKLTGLEMARFDDNDKYWAALKTDYYYNV